MNNFKSLAYASLFTIFSSSSYALVVVGENADAILSSTGAGAQGSGTLSVVNPANAQIRVGNWNAGSGRNFGIGYVFELPDLGAGNIFDTATLNFTLNSLGGTFTYNADLYGIDARASSSLITSDFYVGDDTDPNATKLQDSILTPSSAVGTIVSVDISDYLNTQYSGGANIGNFVFLRLNRDGSTAIFDQQTGYLVASANDTDAGDKPFLDYTITPVPEPSSYALLAGALGLAYVMVRRRS